MYGVINSFCFVKEINFKANTCIFKNSTILYGNILKLLFEVVVKGKLINFNCILEERYIILFIIQCHFMHLKSAYCCRVCKKSIFSLRFDMYVKFVGM